VSFALLPLPARPRAARRVTAMAVGVLALTLTGCSETGFDAQTNAIYDPGAGTNESTGNVPVLGVLVVSSEDGSGSLSATISRRSTDELQLTGVTATAGDEPIDVTFGEPLDVPSNRAAAPLKLSQEADNVVVLDGDAVAAGRFVELTFEFSNGQTIDLEAPVVARDGEGGSIYDDVLDGTVVDEEKPAEG
jgi:hypothetical protein